MISFQSDLTLFSNMWKEYVCANVWEWVTGWRMERWRNSRVCWKKYQSRTKDSLKLGQGVALRLIYRWAHRRKGEEDTIWMDPHVAANVLCVLGQEVFHQFPIICSLTHFLLPTLLYHNFFLSFLILQYHIIHSKQSSLKKLNIIKIYWIFSFFSKGISVKQKFVRSNF